MNGLGGLNKSEHGVVLGMVQLQLPVIEIRADVTQQAARIVELVGKARAGWGVENNIYQLGHRGFTAVKGGAGDCLYTFMHDLVAGQYRLPWDEQVKVTDGTSCGFPVPTRANGETTAKAAE